MNKTFVRAWQLHCIDDFVHIGIVVQNDEHRQALTAEGPVEMQRFREIPAIAVLEPSAAQELIDDLWRCGVRPSEGKGSAGQLKAVEKHLEDFRKIVAKKIGVEL